MAVFLLGRHKKISGNDLTEWRTYLSGQRAAHAPSGAEAGRATQGTIPRLAPHLRHLGPAKRGGCENRVRNAGPLLRRVYSGHIRPQHQCSPETGGADHGECAFRGGVTSIATILKKGE